MTTSRTSPRPFRAVVSDLDGTLLAGDHKIGQFTIETLEKLAAQQVDIFLATGRNYTDVKHIISKVKVDNATLITSNGAQAHNLAGQLLYSRYLPESVAFALMQLPFDTTRVCLNTYQGEGWFINVDIEVLRKYHQDSGFMYDVVDFAQHHGRETEKVFFIGKTLQDLEPLEQQIRAQFGDQVHIAYSTPQCLEIMRQGVTKAATLAHLVAERDYQLADCLAFGDGMNDLELLSEVGKGCVMGNADPRLMRALPQHEHIGHHRDQAVASYLRAIFALR